jgi:hypothetical protein
MPNQLQQISINGQQVSVTLGSFSITLPPEVAMTKVNNNTLQLVTNLAPFAPKWMPSIIAGMLGTRVIQWNLDSGTLTIQ